MFEKERTVLEKITAIENVIENIKSCDFDTFEVHMIKDGQKVGEFSLIEKSKEQAYFGILNQLKFRLKELADEFKAV